MPHSSMPRLILTGPESTGKSALATAIADHMDAVLVREYLRDYFDLHGALTLEDALPIAQGQWVNEERGALTAKEQNRLLVCDTDLLSSLVYNRFYYSDAMNTPLFALWEQWSERHRKRLKLPPFSPRLYILCGIDWPWVADGQRDAPDMRPQFYRHFNQELQSQACQYIEVSGSLEDRLSAVLAQLVHLHLHRE